MKIRIKKYRASRINVKLKSDLRTIHQVIKSFNHVSNIKIMNILVINAHKLYPYSPGKLNRFLFDTIVEYLSSCHNVNTTVIEDGYTIEEEIEKYKLSDVIIFQSPINWYNIPWSFKKYIDDIYKAGEFYVKAEKYGQGGKLLNKKYMLSLTCSAAEDEYISTDGFFNIRTIDDIFINFHKTHEYCGMRKLKTFVVYDVFRNIDTDKIKTDLLCHLKTYISKS